MVERPSDKIVRLCAPAEDFDLKEKATYPNKGVSLFYTHDRCALIIDDGICDIREGERVFDYSLITCKQNEYVARYDTVFRVLEEDVATELMRLLSPATQEFDRIADVTPTADRANNASVSYLEKRFEDHWMHVYGDASAKYLTREYSIADIDGRVRYIDFLIRTRDGMIGVEENGRNFHHPQIIGKQRYRTQLAKQNSCQLAGIKLFRFSTEDLTFAEQFEDDIKTYFGANTDRFLESGMLVTRPFELYEHQADTLAEISRQRAAGTKCFLAVFPTASGKSRIVEEDIARFAPSVKDFRALILVPSRQIAQDWEARVKESLTLWADKITVATYGYIYRHYTEYDPTHFSYLVVDEAHHAVAPMLKRSIQYFDPQFLIGLTATDQRPDKKSLTEVFGAYRVGLSLEEAMARDIVAHARAFRIESNIDLSHVRINGQDYVNADLEKTLRVPSRNQLIADVLTDYFTEGAVAKLQGVVFCVNVRHATEMAKLLMEAGITAASITGTTKKADRIMEDFRAKRIRFLCSCQMISEGWDYPELGILVMARPTLSRVLYLQQLGRGLRKTPTKSDVFVIDVVDEYSAMVKPCSLHSIFHNPYYVPFGDVSKTDYHEGDVIEIAGLHEVVERIEEVDVISYAEKYEGYLSVEQLAREYFVSTGTINSWIKKGRITPTASFTFGSKRINLFSPEDVQRIREDLNIAVHNDETMRADFMAFLESRDYSLSYKMPFVLSFLDHMDPLTGCASIDEVLDDYIAFYRNRIEQGLVVDRRTCPYNENYIEDRTKMRASMLTNPFEKFERKRFIYYSKELGSISMNHALLSQLNDEDFEAIRAQMHEDLKNYYAALES